MLPACGGVYDQDPQDLRYLNITLDRILEYRNKKLDEESKKK